MRLTFFHIYSILQVKIVHGLRRMPLAFDSNLILEWPLEEKKFYFDIISHQFPYLLIVLIFMIQLFLITQRNLLWNIIFKTFFQMHGLPVSVTKEK